MPSVRIVVALLTFGLVLQAQVPSGSLAPANGRIDAMLDQILDLRELSDGRVLVLDWARGIVLVDFARNKADILVRKGPGPLEYRGAAFILPLGRDSSAICDHTISCLLLDGDRPLRTVNRESFIGLRIPADRTIHASSKHFFMYRQGTIGSSEPDAMVLVDRRTGTNDTVARLLDLDRKNGRYVVLSEPEAAVLFIDDWCAVVRRNPYRVDWRRPDGKLILGKPLPERRKKLDHDEQEEYMRQRGLRLQKPPEAAKIFDPWPDFYPTFSMDLQFRSAQPTPDGSVLIHLTQIASDPPGNHFDIVNRRGIKEGHLVLAASDRIAGFGRHSVYVLVVDSDGGEALERHPWPPAGRK